MQVVWQELTRPMALSKMLLMQQEVLQPSALPGGLVVLGPTGLPQRRQLLQARQARLAVQAQQGVQDMREG